MAATATTLLVAPTTAFIATVSTALVVAIAPISATCVLLQLVVEHFLWCLHSLLYCHCWRGAVQILSTVPTVDWVLLGSGESNKG